MNENTYTFFLTFCNHCLKATQKQFKTILTLKTQFENFFNEIFWDFLIYTLT